MEIQYDNEEQLKKVIEELEDLASQNPCKECESCEHCEIIKLIMCVEYEAEYFKTHTTQPICVYCKVISASKAYWTYTLKNDKPEFLCEACFDDHNEELEELTGGLNDLSIESK